MACVIKMVWIMKAGDEERVGDKRQGECAGAETKAGSQLYR